MATTSSVPLMSDIEGQDTEERPSDIKNDFSYHNNVAGAPAMIRKGFLKKVNRCLTRVSLHRVIYRLIKMLSSGLQIHYLFIVATLGVWTTEFTVDDDDIDSWSVHADTTSQRSCAKPSRISPCCICAKFCDPHCTLLETKRKSNQLDPSRGICKLFD